TFEGFKRIGNYDLVLGATFLCPHLTLYTARGRRKRDYPPNWNYQQTYWTELKPLNDYFTRLGWLMTQGEPRVDIVVLHPVESGAAGHRFAVDSSLALPGENFDAAGHYDAMLRRTLGAILNAGYECDLGDEIFLEEMGAVEGDRLRIGAVSYSVVVVPPSATWRPHTLALLRHFAANGGTLVFVGELPVEVDGAPNAEAWRALAAHARTVPCSRVQVAAAMDTVAPRRFRLRDPDGQIVPATYVQHRADGEDEVFFIANVDGAAARDYEFSLAGDAPLAVWDPLTGERRAVPGARYRFTLAPAGALVLVAGPNAADGAPPVAAPPALDGEVVPLPDTWAFTRSEPNVLVMDRPDVSVDGGETWWGPDLEFRQRRKLAEHFGIADALQWQPWVAIRKGLFDGKGGEVTLRYRVHSALERPTAALVMEDLRRATALTVNGRPVEISALDWHWDRGFDKVEIGAYLTAGENVIAARLPYDFRTEIEAAYLVGDFGVRLVSPYEGELVPEPARLASGSWVEQGYPFYSGAITYRTTIAAPAGRAFLRLKGASGILYHVRVNGVEVGPILWRPHVVELTAALRPGENALEIEVVSSRQNTLGPLHEKAGDDNRWVGPGAFEGPWQTRDELSLFDYGLLGGAEIVVV
ncbi:MAG TPA: hypothetical protein PK794_00405, partial [Armatimonadota bacterium]|nr:hypothetical protein [Armatimonadota bacterium]